MTLRRGSRNILRGWIFPLTLALLLAGCGGGYETRTRRGEGIREWFLEFSWGRVEAYAIWPPGRGPYPAMLLLHGADARAQRFRRAMLTHVRDGFVLISISLPGHGASTGPEDFAGPRSVEAALGAVRYLRSRPNVEKDGIFVYGIGQGATVAALAAARSAHISALILENGLYEWKETYALLSEERRVRIRATLGGPPAQKMRAYAERSPVRAAEKIRVPVLLLHSSKAPYPFRGAETFRQKILEKGGRSANLQKVANPDRFESPRYPNIRKWAIPYIRRVRATR